MAGQRLFESSVGRFIPSLTQSGTRRVFSVYALWLVLLAATGWQVGQVVAGSEPAADTAETMVWPMLPGESVDQLARLFYPGDKAMQRRFVERTRELSAETVPGLDPAIPFSQPAIVVIPDIKALSLENKTRETTAFKRNAKHKKLEQLQMSYQIKDAASIMVTPQMEAEYENLGQRNQLLKDGLQKLHAKLARLQLEMEAMLSRAGQATGPTAAAVTAPAAAQPEKQQPTVVQAPASQVAAPQAEAEKPSAAQSVPTPAEPPATAAAPAEKPTQAEKPAAPASLKKLLPQVANPAPAAEPTNIWFDEDLKWLLLQFALLVLGLIGALFAWRWLRKQLAKKITKATDEQLDGLRKNTFNPDESGFFNTQQPYHIDDDHMGVLSVEEFDSVVDEARILVSMDRINEAINLLRQHIDEQPRSSLQPWVYLFDLYRSLDKKDDFLELAKRFHQAFNVMAPQWEQRQVAMIVATTLEEFPHIIDQLLSMWPNPESKDYLEALIKDNRAGERAGFSIEVAQEIALLLSILEMRES